MPTSAGGRRLGHVGCLLADEASVADADAAQGMDVSTVAAQDSEGAHMMVHLATLEVQVEDVTQAVSKVRATPSGSGGWVESEEVVPGDEEAPRPRLARAARAFRGS